ncbi:hypothetical protein V6Z11_A02G157700 [Gossypium hirsutum]
MQTLALAVDAPQPDEPPPRVRSPYTQRLAPYAPALQQPRHAQASIPERQRTSTCKTKNKQQQQKATTKQQRETNENCISFFLFLVFSLFFSTIKPLLQL